MYWNKNILDVILIGEVKVITDNKKIKAIQKKIISLSSTRIKDLKRFFKYLTDYLS